MNEIYISNFTRRLSAICLVLAPLLLLISSLMSFASPEINYLRYIFGKAGMALMIFAIIALIQMLKPKMEKLALIAGGMAIIGAISGTTLYSFLYYYRELQAIGLDAVALEATGNLFGQVYMTMVFMPLPGWFFPIGLLSLSLGLFAKRIIPRPIAIILALGAITFPMGRIPQFQLMFVITDALFLISMSCIAWQILNYKFVNQENLAFAKA